MSLKPHLLKLLLMFVLMTIGAQAGDSQYGYGLSQKAASASNSSDSSSAQLPEQMEDKYKVGPVAVLIRQKCSPVLKACQAEALISYTDKHITIADIKNPYKPVEKEDITWEDNRFVAIRYFSGGNRGDGIHVALANGNDLVYLGKFESVKGHYLIIPYDVLDGNSLTSRASAPTWPQYFSVRDARVAFDLDKTCSAARPNYETTKAELLKTLREDKPILQSNEPPSGASNQELAAALLETLGLSRYCQWRHEYIEILSAGRQARAAVPMRYWEAIGNELKKVSPP